MILSRPLVIAVTLLAFSGCAPKKPTGGELFYELRAPKTLAADPQTKVDLVTNESSGGLPLKLAKRSEDGEFIVYHFDGALIFDGEQRRAVIVRMHSQPSQVFRLLIPPNPKPTEWTSWQRPDYIEQTDASWTFMHDLKQNSRSADVPTNCFHLRYKIAEWKAQ